MTNEQLPLLGAAMPLANLPKHLDWLNDGGRANPLPRPERGVEVPRVGLGRRPPGPKWTWQSGEHRGTQPRANHVAAVHVTARVALVRPMLVRPMLVAHGFLRDQFTLNDPMTPSSLSGAF